MKSYNINYWEDLHVMSWDYADSPCDKCRLNPNNGGTGLCHCTLGLKEIK